MTTADDFHRQRREYGVIKTTGTNVAFAGSFTNNGALLSDRSTQNLVELTISATGYLQGSTGDVFNVLGNVTNNSQQNSLFNIAGAQLTLETGLGTHQFSGIGLYVTTLKLDGGVTQISNITGNGGDIYYDPTASGNAYLNDQTYPLEGSGFLEPIGTVPEPSAWVMMLGGSLVLGSAAYLRRGRSCRVANITSPA